MFKQFFKRRKYRAIAFAEVQANWKGGTSTLYSVVFFENDNGDRKWIESGGQANESFMVTTYYAPCETWRHTGLLPEWAKDPLAEKLSR